MIDSPSAGSCLIPASLEPVQNSFLHREMGDSDGCQGNADSAKPFPFSANEVVEEMVVGGGGGGVWAFATEVVTKSFTSTEEGLITLQESDYSLLLLQSNSCEKDSDPPSLFKCSYH